MQFNPKLHPSLSPNFNPVRLAPVIRLRLWGAIIGLKWSNNGLLYWSLKLWYWRTSFDRTDINLIRMLRQNRAQMVQRGSRKGKGWVFGRNRAPLGRGGWIIEEGWGLDRIKTNGNVDTDTTDEAAARLLWLTDTVTGPPASHDTQTSLMEFASDPHFIVTGQDQDDWSPQSRVTNWNQSPHWNWPGCIDRAECTGTGEMLTK